MAPSPQGIDDTQFCKLGLDQFALENVGDKDYKHPMKIVWTNVFIWIVMHSAALYALTLVPQCFAYTILWALFLDWYAKTGITAGTHRLWSHRSYKATTPFKVFLVIGSAIAWQNSIYEWARDHRVHHKFSETDADPHNSKRGFFFCHMGWLMVKKHPEVIKKGKAIDLSDLHAEPVVMFQHRHWVKMGLLFNVIIPTLMPMLWGESAWNGFFVAFVLRYLVTLHITWTVNSLSHMFGYKPYDTRIAPNQNWFVATFALGEGWHNFHHTFPHDYATSELKWTINTTTWLIDFLSLFGICYDRRKITDKVIENRKLRTGPDGNLEQKVEQKLAQKVE